MNPLSTIDVDQSFLKLVLDASPVVQLVMLLLLCASVVSWAIIIRKRRTLGATRAAAESFETSFWSGGDLGALYRAIEGKKGKASGMESIFEFGFREFTRLRKQTGIDPSQLMEGARRAMKVAQLREIDRLESNLEMLATIGSISPYVGLFGTVWGIMHAFRGLANVQQATLQMVAPGISEALIATAIGLFAAIPAVVAYNRFSDQVNRLELRFDTFMEEFSTILQRHSAAARGT
jgi:biopolymer transport protein TolQ